MDDKFVAFLIGIIQVVLWAASIVISVWLVIEAKKTTKFNTVSDVIYYLEKKNGNANGIVENIGRGEAFNVRIEMKFDKGLPSTLSKGQYNLAYLAPNQKYSYWLGHILISLNSDMTQSSTFGSHQVDLKYFENKKLKKEIIKTYNITEEQVINLYNNGESNDINKSLEKISRNLENMNK